MPFSSQNVYTEKKSHSLSPKCSAWHDALVLKLGCGDAPDLQVISCSTSRAPRGNPQTLLGSYLSVGFLFNRQSNRSMAFDCIQQILHLTFNISTHLCTSGSSSMSGAAASHR